MAIVKGDFIELNYTGSVAVTADSPGFIFDTTSSEIASKARILSQRVYGTQIICVGEGQVLPALDIQLIGKNPNSSFKVALKSSEAFGEKSAKLIRLIPLTRFKDQQMTPHTGMPVTIDNTPGIVKTVSSGRVLVDFNHPLAGKDVEYAIQIGNVVTDLTVQLKSILISQFKNTTGVVNGTVATVTFPQELPKEFHSLIEQQIKRLIPKLTAIEFKSVTGSKPATAAASSAAKPASTAPK